MILIKHHNQGDYEPYFYFALEEYILNELLKEDESYFFTYQIKGVVIGKNQVLENEVNIEYLKQNQIKIFRRPTGGGCVYADENNTMFAIITKKKDKNFSFKDYLVKVIDAFKELGISLEFSGRNDITFEGKKVSGNAFLQNKNGMLMHGTLLYDCDIETMVRSITPADEKLISKGVESVRSRVVNLKPYLKGLTQAEVIKHLNETLTNQEYELTNNDIHKINQLAKKYQRPEWIYYQQPPFEQKIKQRFPWGLAEISLNINYGVIESMKIQGDFFDLKDLKEFEELFEGINYDYSLLEEILMKNDLSEYILGASSTDVLVVLKEKFLS